jgi:hypothetical protein
VRASAERTGATAGAAAASLVLAGVLAAPPPVASAQSAPGLSITVPATASLGSAPVGERTLTAALGQVRVTTSGGLLGTAGWTATVSTTGFSTGGGTASERVEPAAVSYRSGPATASSGLALAACAPGQLLAPVSLSAPRTAFSCTGISLVGSTSLTWVPELSVTLGESAVAGTYTGSVVHSVA